MRKTLVLTLVCVMLASGCTQPDISEYSETRSLIGTFITVTIYTDDESQAKEAIDASFAEMDRLGGELSHYSKSNKVYDLNTKGFDNPVEVTRDLGFVIGESLKYSDVSSGVFDVTVQPLIVLWSGMKDGGIPPTEEQVLDTLELIGYDNLAYNGSHAWFTKPNMSVTFGGIAKGYIVDKGLAALKENGIRHALINAGGDIAVYGGKPGGKDWVIALQNPRNENDYLTRILIKNGAVATSGDYERYYVPDKSVHHIVDPRTGYSATKLISATIIAENATQADALATAVFVLGAEDGVKLAESVSGVDALVIKSDRSIIKSGGYPS